VTVETPPACPGAFVMAVENLNSFSDVLVKKLISEITQAAHQHRAGN
jgi:hypothetical protein